MLLDIDGTLVDSNYHHTLAWSRAFRRGGHVVAITDIHRTIGMGRTNCSNGSHLAATNRSRTGGTPSSNRSSPRSNPPVVDRT